MTAKANEKVEEVEVEAEAEAEASAPSASATLCIEGELAPGTGSDCFPVWEESELVLSSSAAN